VSVEVPSADDVLSAARRLRARGQDVALDVSAASAHLSVDDPWGNRVEVASAA